MYCCTFTLEETEGQSLTRVTISRQLRGIRAWFPQTLKLACNPAGRVWRRCLVLLMRVLCVRVLHSGCVSSAWWLNPLSRGVSFPLWLVPFWAIFKLTTLSSLNGHSWSSALSWEVTTFTDKALGQVSCSGLYLYLQPESHLQNQLINKQLK